MLARALRSATGSLVPERAAVEHPCRRAVCGRRRRRREWSAGGYPVAAEQAACCSGTTILAGRAGLRRRHRGGVPPDRPSGRRCRPAGSHPGRTAPTRTGGGRGGGTGASRRAAPTPPVTSVRRGVATASSDARAPPPAWPGSWRRGSADERPAPVPTRPRSAAAPPVAAAGPPVSSGASAPCRDPRGGERIPCPGVPWPQPVTPGDRGLQDAAVASRTPSRARSRRATGREAAPSVVATGGLTATLDRLTRDDLRRDSVAAPVGSSPRGPG